MCSPLHSFHYEIIVLRLWFCQDISTTNYADKRIIRLGVQALAWQDSKLEFGKIVKRGACY